MDTEAATQATSPASEALHGTGTPNGSGGFQDYLQNISEREKTRLVRDLHDELGGLLVGAIMDLAWADQHWTSKPQDAHDKFTRARQSLAAAIDFKRKIVERLRPSLLDNVGLFAALRWHVKAICAEIGFQCRIELPDTELHLLPRASIALFRTVQEGYEIFSSGPNRSAHLAANADRERLEISIVGTKSPLPGPSDYAILSIRQRVAMLGGETAMHCPPDSTMRFTATVPMRNILMVDQSN